MNSKAYAISFLCVLTALFFVFRSIETNPTSGDENGEDISLTENRSDNENDLQMRSLSANDFKSIETQRNARAKLASPKRADDRMSINSSDDLDKLLSMNHEETNQSLLAEPNRPAEQEILVNTLPIQEDNPVPTPAEPTSNPIDLSNAVKQEAETPGFQENYPSTSTPHQNIPAQVTREPDMLTPTTIKKVRQHINYGRSLARKGSTFAATSEFMQGLKLIAQYWDQQTRTNEYSKALENGFVALKEAEDFVVKESDGQNFVEPESVIRSHRSKVVTVEECAKLPAVEILAKYMKFVQAHFVKASGGSPLAADIHYSLGKLHLTLANFNKQSEVNKARSIVLFRASFAVNPQHSLAANELAVILAQNGHWDAAKRLLTVSLRSNPTPMAWKNLASIHRKLNEFDLAEAAMNEHAQMINSGQTTSPVQWVAPQQFSQSTPEMYQQQMANQNNANSQNRGQPHLGRGYQESHQTANKPRLIDRVKKLFR